LVVVEVVRVGVGVAMVMDKEEVTINVELL
jgi:hypothetical protein